MLYHNALKFLPRCAQGKSHVSTDLSYTLSSTPTLDIGDQVLSQLPHTPTCTCFTLGTFPGGHACTIGLTLLCPHLLQPGTSRPSFPTSTHRHPSHLLRLSHPAVRTEDYYRHSLCQAMPDESLIVTIVTLSRHARRSDDYHRRYLCHAMAKQAYRCCPCHAMSDESRKITFGHQLKLQSLEGLLLGPYGRGKKGA
jgi:hypothetical protein